MSARASASGSAASAPRAGKGARMAYKPVGLLSGVVAGAISTAIVRQVWKRVSDEGDPPTALQRSYPWGEIVVAALVQGAVFGVVRAFVQRGGAKGVQRLTGTWPGD